MTTGMSRCTFTAYAENAFYLQFADIHIYIIFSEH